MRIVLSLLFLSRYEGGEECSGCSKCGVVGRRWWAGGGSGSGGEGGAHAVV